MNRLAHPLLVAVLAAFPVVVASGALLGRGGAISALTGALGGAAIQWIATCLLLRAHGVETAAFLRAFARASMLRVLGGTVFVIAALAGGVLAPLPFVAGFGVVYLLLEVVADVKFVRNEKNVGRVT